MVVQKTSANGNTKVYQMKVKNVVKATDTCAICRIKAYNAKSKKMRRMIWHHTRYQPERIALLCFSCHAWLHGLCKVYRHPLKEEYGKDVAPYIFAKRVVDLYERDKEE